MQVAAIPDPSSLIGKIHYCSLIHSGCRCHSKTRVPKVLTEPEKENVSRDRPVCTSPAVVTKSCPDRFGTPQTSTTLVYCIYEVHGRAHSTSITVSAGSAVQDQGCWHGGQAVRFDDKGTGVWIRDAYANEDAKGVCNSGNYPELDSLTAKQSLPPLKHTEGRTLRYSR